jgi:DNA polymerase I-like protein with 3'-5' exonuclease and polymerase domains
LKYLCLDVETKVTDIVTVDPDSGKEKLVKDNSPFNPENYLVSCNWRKIEDGVIGSNNYTVFRHNEQQGKGDPTALQEALDWADCVVAHNAKYDVMWLKEAGFRLPDTIRCTMILEYILYRGVKKPLSLEEIAKRRQVTHKKSELTDSYWKQGIGFEAMPLAIVLEYADADVLSCAEVFIQQLEDYQKPENKSLNNVLTLMNEMLLFIVEIERNGIQIDTVALDKVEEDYRTELAALEKRMNEIAVEVMGDTPINLSSGEDISKLVYSREFTDKKNHKIIFNLGTDELGNPMWPPRMSPAKFAEAVRRTTKKVQRTEAQHCTTCAGHGFIRKTKQDGTPYKKTTKCTICEGRGYVLAPTGVLGGLKLVPSGPEDASVNGFKTDKETIELLIDQAKRKGNLLAVEFLVKKQRLNAINTYLNSFVMGIKRWTRSDNIIHPKYNQCSTSTARLSSNDPNYQNQPRDASFPIRKVVVSRFDNGRIIETDFSGLEFVTAGELSRDPQIIEDVLTGKDIHSQTAVIVHQITNPEDYDFKGKHKWMRSEVKPDTFAPLYGAQGKNKPEHIRRYYEQFFNIYKRHGEWQIEQMDEVMHHGFIQTPSGRQYAFPGTRRIRGKRTTNATKIVNFPIQGYATGDIVPLACVRTLRKFKELKLRSVLILTVHDSIVVDAHPDEIQTVCEVLKWATQEVTTEIKDRWGYEHILPLKSETSVGGNWGSLEAIH